MNKPRKFVRMVKPRFAPAVRSGDKTQTFRPTPKVMPQPGDLLSRVWDGRPYWSKQLPLIDTTVLRVRPARVTEAGIVMEHIDGNRLLAGDDADRFARADGFSDWPEMKAWMTKEHKRLPVVGVVIYWPESDGRLTISQVWGLGFMLLAFGMAASGIILDARRWLRRDRKNKADAAARRAGQILNGKMEQGYE